MLSTTTTILIALLGASNILAAPIDLTSEGLNVDVNTFRRRAPGPSPQTQQDWAHGASCSADNTLTGCTGGHTAADDKQPPNEKRDTPSADWIPPTLVPTGIGSECNIDTCIECPTFPGCEEKLARDSKPKPVLKNYAAPPKEAEKRSPQGWSTPGAINGIELGAGPACSLETCDLCPDHPGCSEKQSANGQPPKEEKRQIWSTPSAINGIELGAGPACSLETCDMCPDHPGCSEKQSQPPRPEEKKRSAEAKAWIVPPTGVFVGVGPECSINSCDMCPTFPGCAEKLGEQEQQEEQGSGAGEGGWGPRA